MKKPHKFFASVVLGATAGFVAGLLTAPKAGKDTRAELEKKGKQALKKTKKLTEGYYDSAKTASKSFFDKLFDKKESNNPLLAEGNTLEDAKNNSRKEHGK